MTLRKITIDKSVRYIQQIEQTQSFSKDRITRKKLHFLVNKTKMFHKTMKK